MKKYIIFEFDPTVGDDNLVIGTNYDNSGTYENLINILDFLD
jgi:hypothetical protein